MFWNPTLRLKSRPITPGRREAWLVGLPVYRCSVKRLRLVRLEGLYPLLTPAATPYPEPRAELDPAINHLILKGP